MILPYAKGTPEGRREGQAVMWRSKARPARKYSGVDNAIYAGRGKASTRLAYNGADISLGSGATTIYAEKTRLGAMITPLGI